MQMHSAKRKPSSTKLRHAGVIAAIVAVLSVAPAGLGTAAPPDTPAKKPNILFIMGDDIGWMQPGIYHQGLAVGETPNIDRIGHEGAKFMTTTPSRVARRGATPFSPACIRCAPA